MAAFNKPRTEVGFAATIADVPLATRHNFKWAFTFFKKFHRVHNGAWFAEHFLTCAQHLNNESLGLLNRFSCKLCVCIYATCRSNDLRCVSHNATIATDNGASGQLQFTPPNNVGDVAKGTDHGNACAFFYLCKRVSKYGHFNVEEWCANGCAK